ncbi:MAG: cobaltochelatase subunit CobN [Parabacteroides distasonis]
MTPEIDGAIRPFALFAQYKRRWATATLFRRSGTVGDICQHSEQSSHLENKTHQRKSTRSHRSTTKCPGQMPSAASGMEVGPSLYNLLPLRMKKEGYRIENLPESAGELGA